MKRMCWFYKNTTDDRLYVEYGDKFVPYDELPSELSYDDKLLNHLLSVISDGESDSVSKGYTAMLMLKKLHGYQLVNGREL